jgi:hypothetical protein
MLDEEFASVRFFTQYSSTFWLHSSEMAFRILIYPKRDLARFLSKSSLQSARCCFGLIWMWVEYSETYGVVLVQYFIMSSEYI